MTHPCTHIFSQELERDLTRVQRQITKAETENSKAADAASAAQSSFEKKIADLEAKNGVLTIENRELETDKKRQAEKDAQTIKTLTATVLIRPFFFFFLECCDADHLIRFLHWTINWTQ